MGGHNDSESRGLLAAAPECAQRTITAAFAGVMAGCMGGSIVSAWSDPKVSVGGTVTAVRTTSRVIGRYAVVLGAVGAIYASVQCALRDVTQSRPILSGMAAGCAAGAFLGIREGNVKKAVGACAALATMSAAVDMFDGRARPDLDRKRFFPYHTQNRDE
eukprot:c9461_g1_i1.p1 GENE.c9461_g1_i1~~c9461_g1_i1.p1  ORF type:complete len:182 (+),score=5.84 c9461_g1_i1:69-548(+)